MNSQPRSVDSIEPAVKILPAEIKMNAELKTSANPRKIVDPVHSAPHPDGELAPVDPSIPLFFLL